MKGKILVEIYLPPAGKCFDVFIPADSRMSDLVPLVSEALSELSEGRFRGGTDTVLCSRDTGMIYNMNLKITELQIENGSRLMLI